MWIVSIYSLGDICNDDYLNEFSPENGYSNELGYKPRFLDDIDLQLRLDMVKESIKRLENEKEILEKYGGNLIGINSWEELK